MNICVIGLGLIGGSLCKTIKKHTNHTVYGIDKDPHAVSSALKCGAIDHVGDDKSLENADLSIVCLYPELTVSWICSHAKSFKKGSLVIDVCGIKKEIIVAVSSILEENEVEFIGTHPMAGREFSGFDYSVANLFDNASFIITPTEGTSADKLEMLKSFAKELHFKNIVLSTPEQHDQIIAYTSQLAHVVSSAYVKSPTLDVQAGFSAGSFQDLTRVAKLNEDMWTSLFMLNRESLIPEIDTIIGHLQEYKDALEAKDNAHLCELLKDGRIKKENSMK